MKELITSVQNPLVKKVKRLSEKAAERKEENLFVVEGIRECSLMQQRSFAVDTLIVCEEIFKQSKAYPISFSGNLKYVSSQVYEAIAYRGKSEGVLALAVQKATTFQDVEIGKNPLMLVIAAVEKPGNLGAMLRTADAVGIDAVIVCDEKADIFNPNVIRSSLGTIFTNKLIVCSWEEANNYFIQKGIRSFAAHLKATKSCFECDFKAGTAIVVGSEADGLSENISSDCTDKLIIPMLGQIDSLNVSVSAAVLLYEAVRQRIAQK